MTVSILTAHITVKARNGAGVTALHELNPEDDESGMRVAPAHLRDEPVLLGGMPVSLISDGGVGDTIFISIFDK